MAVTCRAKETVLGLRRVKVRARGCSQRKCSYICLHHFLVVAEHIQDESYSSFLLLVSQHLGHPQDNMEGKGHTESGKLHGSWLRISATGLNMFIDLMIVQEKTAKIILFTDAIIKLHYHYPTDRCRQLDPEMKVQRGIILG